MSEKSGGRLHCATCTCYQGGNVTARQSQIIALIAAGRQNKEIARELCLSDHTVKNHIADIFLRLGVSNRVEIARHYFEMVRGQEQSLGQASSTPPNEEAALARGPEELGFVLAVVAEAADGDSF